MRDKIISIIESDLPHGVMVLAISGLLLKYDLILHRSEDDCSWLGVTINGYQYHTYIYDTGAFGNDIFQSVLNSEYKE